MTDAHGEFVADGCSIFNGFNFHTEKLGYYSTASPGFDRPIFRERINGRWEPWNPKIETMLKPVKSPTSMYAKKVELRYPGTGDAIGYDLVIGDWVAPFGKGETADFLFEAQRTVRDDRNYEGSLTLRFSNTGDGLVPFDKPRDDGSELRLPYLAPQDGYFGERIWREERQTAPDGHDVVRSDTSSTMNYFFRIRTVVDAEGKVVSALFGKIHGDIRYFIGTRAPQPGLAFTYYLNPDGTRNVEFDPKRNLFPHDDRDSAFWNLKP